MKHWIYFVYTYNQWQNYHNEIILSTMIITYIVYAWASRYMHDPSNGVVYWRLYPSQYLWHNWQLVGGPHPLLSPVDTKNNPQQYIPPGVRGCTPLFWLFYFQETFQFFYIFIINNSSCKSSETLNKNSSWLQLWITTIIYHF